MNDDEKRKKLHEILDLVIDVNGLEERDRRKTGNLPTVFMGFSGHIGALSVETINKGYYPYIEKDFHTYAYFDEKSTLSDNFEEDAEKIIEYLEGLKNGKNY